MTNQNGSENGNGKRSRRITRDDLTKSIEAARVAAEAAVGVAEATLAALDQEKDEDMPDEGVPEGEALRPQPKGAFLALEEFMARLKGVLGKVGDSVQVTENAAWVKIESRKNGHKVYVSKGKNAVHRVESTLPPSAVPGAHEPGRRNGRIASWIPADVSAVAEAIRQLATSDIRLRPPHHRGEASGAGGVGPRKMRRLPS